MELIFKINYVCHANKKNVDYAKIKHTAISVRITNSFEMVNALNHVYQMITRWKASVIHALKIFQIV